MEIIVMYKPNKIEQIGEIHPQDIEIGLASYNGWEFAKVQADKMHEYKEFNFITIPKEVFKGILLYNMHPGDDEDFNKEEQKFELSEEEDKLIKNAKEYIKKIEEKIKIRAEIRQLKDINDDLLDLKRVTYFLMNNILIDWNDKSNEEKEKSKVKGLISKINETVKSKKDILNVLDIDLNKIEKIIDDEINISKIVQKYFSNIKQES